MPMSMTGPPERRGFKSRSPDLSTIAVDEEPVKRGWGSVTRHQISGWRFQIRRLSNGVALHDTDMLSDPLRRHARAVIVSLLIGGVLLGGAFVLSILKPAGVTGNRPVLADRSSGALYVVVNDQLHPVWNLASARLIVGKPVNPAAVKSSEIDKFRLSNTLGIAGAPDRMVQNSARDARWMVCDAVSGHDVGATVIAGDPVPGSGHAAGLPDSSAVLATSDGGATNWLIWGNKRSKIDLEDAAVVSSVGISVDTAAPRSIDRRLLNLIPESVPLVAPFVANAGDPVRFVWPAPGDAPPIGSVVVDHEANGLRHYVVSGDGLQPVSPVVAAMLRASNSYGLVEPPALTPDQVAKAPSVRAIAVDNYPSVPVSVVDATAQPVLCGQWVKLAGSPTSSLTLLVGQSLPIKPDAQRVSLTGGGREVSAARVVMPKGSGYFVQVTGQHPTATTRESVFWVSDLGVRYGVEDSANQHVSAAVSLGMTAEPLPIPWAALSLLQAGPTLSKDDALVAH